MQLVSFAMTNHKSIRDRMELDLAAPALKGLRPTGGHTWSDVLHPVVGIFGSNASGKTAVIDAMHYAQTAVRASAAGWMGESAMPRASFKLDPAAIEAPSQYELVFVHDAGQGPVRYEYTFSVSAAGVEHESLHDLPSTRRRLIFERVGGTTHRFEPGKALRQSASLHAVAPRELVLSRALVLDHPQLAPIARALTEQIDVVSFGEHHRKARIGALIDSLKTGDTTFDDLVALLQVADIGVTSVDIREEEAPPYIRRIVAMLRSQSTGAEADTTSADVPIGDDAAVEVIGRTLEFHHRGADAASQPLNLEEESAGTMAWLALAIPAVDALRRGGVLFVDELDASLHSHLVEVYLQMFADPDLNRTGAQLVFSSHDSHLLSTKSSVQLGPTQVWFTAKSAEGVTDLYSLADFPHDRGENVANRYLNGRYGGIPYLAPSLLYRLVEHRDVMAGPR